MNLLSRRDKELIRHLAYSKTLGRHLREETTVKIGRVIGTAVATVKARSLESYKLLLVRDFNDDAGKIKDADADYYVAIDTVGAGVDEVVLVAFGSAARLTSGPLDAPVDAAIIAILDNVRIGNTFAFERK
jgi:ethanolamine utilization protein EutN